MTTKSLCQTCFNFPKRPRHGNCEICGSRFDRARIDAAEARYPNWKALGLKDVKHLRSYWESRVPLNEREILHLKHYAKRHLLETGHPLPRYRHLDSILVKHQLAGTFPDVVADLLALLSNRSIPVLPPVPTPEQQHEASIRSYRKARGQIKKRFDDELKQCETLKPKSGYIYVIVHLLYPQTKIGATWDMDDRMEGYHTSIPEDHHIVIYKRLFNNKDRADNIIKQHFATKSVGLVVNTTRLSEWYNISTDEAVEYVSAMEDEEVETLALAQ